MHNYWLGIMAVAFVLALAIWLFLVFNADRHPHGRPHESLPHREVIGGEFEARDGGRQLMPIPGEPSRPESATAGAPADLASAVPEQAAPVRAGQDGPGQSAGPEHAGVPRQGAAPRPEQAARTDQH